MITTTVVVSMMIFVVVIIKKEMNRLQMLTLDSTSWYKFIRIICRSYKN